MDWDHLQHGMAISIVCQVVVQGPKSLLVTTVDKPNRKVKVVGELPSASSGMWTILAAKVIDVKNLTIEVGGASSMHPIGPCTCSQLCQVVELCCGVVPLDFALLLVWT